MKVLFAHDHQFVVDEAGDVYSPGRLTYESWSRYLCVFSEVVVVARTQPLAGSKEKLSKSSGPGVRFVLHRNGPGLLGKFQRLAGIHDHRVREEAPTVSM